MNWRLLTGLTMVTALAVGLSTGSSVAQQKSAKDQLVGNWIFVSSTTKGEDGGPAWGANPKGLLIFAENGRYSSHLMRSDRPKFGANNRAKGTPEEYRAATVGNVSSFGAYTVDEAKKTFTIRFEGSSYPNLRRYCSDSTVRDCWQRIARHQPVANARRTAVEYCLSARQIRLQR